MSQKSYVPHICSQVCIELISYEITVFRPKTAKFRVKYLLGNLANYQDLTSIKQTQFSWFLTCQNNLWTNQKDFFFRSDFVGPILIGNIDCFDHKNVKLQNLQLPVQSYDLNMSDTNQSFMNF